MRITREELAELTAALAGDGMDRFREVFGRIRDRYGLDPTRHLIRRSDGEVVDVTDPDEMSRSLVTASPVPTDGDRWEDPMEMEPVHNQGNVWPQRGPDGGKIPIN